MQHCYSAIYCSDCFCPDCGEPLAQNVQTKSLEDIDPSLIASLDETKIRSIFTGAVQRVHYYSLHQLEHTYTKELGYCYYWLELEDAEGNEKKINISAYLNHIETINVGDIVTVCGDFNDKITIPRFNTIDHNIIKNLDLASCVILHSNKAAITSKPSSKPSFENNAIAKPRSIFTRFKSHNYVHIALSLALFFVTFYLTRTEVPAIIVSLLYLLVVVPSLLGIIGHRLLHQYNELNSTLIKIAAITAEQLGCKNMKRRFKSGDYFCHECKSAVAFGSVYCVRCGHKQSGNDNWAFAQSMG